MSTWNANAETSRRTPRRFYRRPVGLLASGRYEVPLGIQLSEGGMLISTRDPQGRERFSLAEMPVGQRLALTMILPSGSVIIIRGSVIYHEKPNASSAAGIGVKFDSVPLTKRREIRNYVSSKSANET